MREAKILTQVRERLAEKARKEAEEERKSRPKLSLKQRLAERKKRAEEDKKLKEWVAKRKAEAEEEARRYAPWFIKKVDQAMKKEPENSFWILRFPVYRNSTREEIDQYPPDVARQCDRDDFATALQKELGGSPFSIHAGRDINGDVTLVIYWTIGA